MPMVLLAVLSTSILTAGCTAGTATMTMSYSAEPSAPISAPGAVVFVTAHDGRGNPDMTEGASPTTGELAAGAILAGPLLLLASQDIEASESQDFIGTFAEALNRRLVSRGVRTTDREEKGAVVVDLLVTQLALDFHAGSWTSDVGYTAIVSREGRVLCEKEVHERVKKLNWNGPRTLGSL